MCGTCDGCGYAAGGTGYIDGTSPGVCWRTCGARVGHGYGTIDGVAPGIAFGATVRCGTWPGTDEPYITGGGTFGTLYGTKYGVAPGVAVGA